MAEELRQHTAKKQMILQNYVYKLPISFGDYTLLITNFHC
jgi:hypothetical protein